MADLSKTPPAPPNPSSPVRSAFAQMAAAGVRTDGEGQPSFSVGQAIGGGRGLVESNAPTVVFLAVYFPTKRLPWAVGAAVVMALAFGVARLVQRQSIQQAFSGLFGVALCGLLVLWTGQMRNYFLLGLVTNAGFFLAYLVSILVRWPLLGLIVGAIRDDPTGWRSYAPLARAYTRASWLWVAVFGLRLAVQVPLYLTKQEGWLAGIKLAMGVPLFAAVIFASWLIIRHPLRAYDQRRNSTGSLAPPA